MLETSTIITRPAQNICTGLWPQKIKHKSCHLCRTDHREQNGLNLVWEDNDICDRALLPFINITIHDGWSCKVVTEEPKISGSIPDVNWNLFFCELFWNKSVSKMLSIRSLYLQAVPSSFWEIFISCYQNRDNSVPHKRGVPGEGSSAKCFIRLAAGGRWATNNPSYRKCVEVLRDFFLFSVLHRWSNRARGLKSWRNANLPMQIDSPWWNMRWNWITHRMN